VEETTENFLKAFYEGRRISGYVVKRCAPFHRIDAALVELQHEGTGARHLHIANADKENAFGVTLKTVPGDSTGVAHILEHTVLCGSRRFPVRDPFFSMLKRSLSTFMNAFTAPDATIYPFSTQNRKDFYNLMDVYLDAVFYPRLDVLSFKQEGHRIEIEEATTDPAKMSLNFKGVVYNEMKGAMSSPDQVMVRSILNALYPDTPYRHNSGGEPSEIPKLTYEALKRFHETHYHPSNAYFYTYGDLPLEAHLEYIAETVLDRFDRIAPETEIPPQRRWDRPRSAEYGYALNSDEDMSRKFQACVAWLTADARNAVDVLTLTLLTEILLGNAASPLRKALMDSRLGSALSDGTGYEPDYRDTLFACGLKDMEGGHAEPLEALILETLTRLADQGIEKALVDSAIHQLEFHRKEITHHPYPYGIKLLMASFGSWLHQGDPFQRLMFEADLEAIQAARRKGPFFKDAIRRFFLENPHRVLLTLSPDPEMEAREASQTRKKLAAVQSALTQETIEALRKEAKALLALQESEEPVHVLPTLEIEDIPPSVHRVSVSDLGKMPALCYEAPTGGIFYFTAAARIPGISREALPLIPFFCYALSKIGTRRDDYVRMAKRIDRWAGGIGFSSSARSRYDAPGESMPLLLMHAKCLNPNQEKLFEILEELLSEFDVFDHDRLETLIKEYRAGLETGVVHNGHRLAMSLASRNFSPALALEELWSGISQLKEVKALGTNLGEEFRTTLSRRLDAVGKEIIQKEHFQMAFIGDGAALHKAARHITRAPFLSTLVQRPESILAQDGPPFHTASETIREGWSTASAVSFVAKAFQTVRMAHEDAPALSVVAKLLRSLYLHREIREKGGAYGAFALYNAETGVFNLCSYRDPHIVETLSAYERAAAFIRSGEYTDTDVKEAILQVCSEMDRPDPPGPAARKAFVRCLLGLSDDDRQRFKEKLLTLKRDSIVDCARRYFDAAARNCAVAVISGEAQLQAANEGLNPPLTLKRI